MKWLYNNKETGHVEEITPERWAWGVIYKPTAEATALADIQTKERNRGLIKERVGVEADLRRKGGTPDEIKALRKEWDIKIEIPIAPVKEELYQFDNDGVFHRVGEIRQDDIEMFVMYRLDDQSKRIDLPWQDGMKLVHKYKMVKPYYLENFVKCYCVGYKFNGQHSFLFILPDDRIVYSPVENVDLSRFQLTQ
jgi:hypothetical protein